MLEGNPNTSLSQLAITADAVMDSLNYAAGDSVSSISTSNNNVSAVSSSDDRFGRLEKRVDSQDKLLQQINSKLGQLLNGDGRSRTRDRTRDRSQNNNRSSRNNTPHRQPSRERNSSTYCWYHNEYGTNARKCEEPCNFKQQQPSSSNSKN